MTVTVELPAADGLLGALTLPISEPAVVVFAVATADVSVKLPRAVVAFTAFDCVEFCVRSVYAIVALAARVVATLVCVEFCWTSADATVELTDVVVTFLIPDCVEFS